MTSALADAARRLIRSVRLHDLVCTTRNGRRVWIKRRHHGMDAIISAGNVFLTFTQSGITMFASPAQWQTWELASFRLLYSADRLGCGMTGRRSIWLEELPGRSLREHIMSKTLSLPMLRAAGAELRRAHALQCPLTHRPWSHGDPHLGNMLYDPASQRARLLDFETRHELSRPARWRHADDLLTFVLELISRSSMEIWPASLDALFEGYANSGVVGELRQRLQAQSPAEFLLWLTRSPESNVAKLKASLPVVVRLLEPWSHVGSAFRAGPP
jgi:hypothetical protein